MRNVLLIILLLEGFITISVEILTMRQLLPFYGGSVVITSIIIGVFLLFLAIGYWRGGLYQQDFFKQLRKNFILSLIWVGIGLSYLLIAVFFYTTVYLLQWSFLLSLVFYLLLFLSPIVYWLGQTVPLTTNLFSQELRVSHISGKALFLSTIGSFLGALLTSLLLFNYLGVAWTVVINCLLLFLLILYISAYDRFSMITIGSLLFALFFIVSLNLNIEQGQFVKTNNYGNYRVLKKDDFSRVLQINESNSSMLTIKKEGFHYIEFIRNILFKQLNLQKKQILIIGAGGFTFAAAGANENEITYVDIDPEIKAVAEKHFLDAAVNGHFVGQDARSYLQQTSQTFDVILSDVYSHRNTIPPALLTQEYFASLNKHLNKGGLVILNIIASPFFADTYSQTMYNTIHRVFPFCTVTPLEWNQALVNVVYICPKLENNEAVYTDDLNRATLDFFRAAIPGT